MKSNFYETWIAESPKPIGLADYYEFLKRNIDELLALGIKPISNRNLRKIDLDSMIYYWFEVNGDIQLAIELEKKPQGLVVHLLGKKDKGIGPYADELYDAILKDSKKGIRLFSDDQVPDSGLLVWKRLLRSGHKILAYDGYNYRILHTENELIDNYNDTAKNIRFVLTESSTLWETKNFFDIQQIRDLAGYNDIKK
jgi:hypothetical protein